MREKGTYTGKDECSDSVGVSRICARGGGGVLPNFTYARRPSAIILANSLREISLCM